MNRKSDSFWTTNIEILYKSDRLAEFIPTSEMSTVEKLNSIARFSIYTGVLLSFVKGKFWPIWISVGGLGLTVFIHQNSEELIGVAENFGISDALASIGINTRGIPGFEGTDLEEIRKKREMDLGPEKVEHINEDGEECILPTDQNPFMNLLVSDYGTDRPQACETDSTTGDLQKDIEEKFNINLFKDVSDLFGKNNSQRQFYTNPVTTSFPDPNGDFKHWLYGNMASCKDDRYDCHPDFEDLRANPFSFPDPDQNPN